MKKFLLPMAFAILCSVAPEGYAQSKITPMGRIALEHLRIPSSEAADSALSLRGCRRLQAAGQKETGVSDISVMVVLNDGHDAGDVAAAGFEVASDLSPVLVVTTDIESVERLASLDAVKSVDFGHERHINNNFTRAAMGVDVCHNAIVDYKEMPFTGKGVIAGIYDTGMMPNHINFMDENGKSRVKRIWHYPGKYSYMQNTYQTPTEIGRFTTDDETESHGTHTLGTMAGSHKASIDYQVDIDPVTLSGSVNESVVNPYYGMAPEADIAIACGTLFDSPMLAGLTNIVNYADEVGKRVVINFSIGTLVGPHDGTDAFSLGLSNLVNRGAVICVAAGNDGGNNLSLELTDEAKTFVQSEYTGYDRLTMGYLDMWSSDNQPFEVEFYKYNTYTGQETSLGMVTGVGSYQFTDPSAFPSYSNFSSFVLSESEVNNVNGRYHVLSDIELAPNSGYELTVRIKPLTPGQKINVWYSSTFGSLESNGRMGYVSGNGDNSIDNEACAKGVISVGAHIEREAFGKLGDSNYYTYNTVSKDDIASFSSHGTSFDGEPLPTVTAPGLSVSSISGHYIVYNENNNRTGNIDDMTAGSVIDGVPHLWGQMMGTSMASPAVAGSIALWLQADPNLTPAQVKDIIAQSAVKDDAVKAKPTQFGPNGKFNAFEGLRRVLALNNMTAVERPEADPDKNVLLSVSAGTLEVFAAGESSFSVRVYDMAGVAMLSGRSSGDLLTLDTTSLSKGVYIVAVDSSMGRIARRIILK